MLILAALRITRAGVNMICQMLYQCFLLGGAMNTARRSLWASLFVTVPCAALAQTAYPDRPIRIIVPGQPGVGTDFVGRLLAAKLAIALGKGVPIENMPGVGGSLGIERVAKAQPDGYTLGVSGDAPLVVNMSVYGKIGYDPREDIAPISQLTITPNILVVHPSLPVKNVHELIALAKANSGKLTYASSGGGTSGHRAGELLKSMRAIDIVQIPYKGSFVNDLIGGHVSMAFMNITAAPPLIRDGRLRALAITSLRRSKAAPELATMSELGLQGYEAVAWQGLIAPAKTPDAIIRRLNAETIKALSSPDLREKLIASGAEIVGGSPEEFAALIKAEIPKWAKLMKASSVKTNL